MELSNDEIRRYSRHLILPEVGIAGQKKLKGASVLCIGTGGLGSPISMYLAAAGIGSPSGWVLRQDHPKRGLVWESPTGPGNAQDAAAVASLFMEATELFCQLQVPGRWRVGIHTPKG